MSQYIEALNRSRADSQKNSLTSVEIELSTLTGKDWAETMGDPSAAWQQGFLTRTLLDLFDEAIWENNGTYYGADYLFGTSVQTDPQHYIDIFDQYVRAFMDKRDLSLEQLVQLLGETMLNRLLAA